MRNGIVVKSWRARAPCAGGMTLVEVVIVLALMVVVGNFALLISCSSYRGVSYHTDRANLVAALEHARAQAIDDVCDGSACSDGAPHGVSIQSDRYVIFQGSSYSTRDMSLDEVVEANSSITHSGTPEVTFSAGSGDVIAPGLIVLSDAYGRTSTTTIGEFGQISWTD